MRISWLFVMHINHLYSANPVALAELRSCVTSMSAFIRYSQARNTASIFFSNKSNLDLLFRQIEATPFYTFFSCVKRAGKKLPTACTPPSGAKLIRIIPARWLELSYAFTLLSWCTDTVFQKELFISTKLSSFFLLSLVSYTSCAYIPAAYSSLTAVPS